MCSEFKRVALLDAEKTVIDARYLKEGESIHPGLVFKFACHTADVGERIEDGDDAIIAEEPSMRYTTLFRLLYISFVISSLWFMGNSCFIDVEQRKRGRMTRRGSGGSLKKKGKSPTYRLAQRKGRATC